MPVLVSARTDGSAAKKRPHLGEFVADLHDAVDDRDAGGAPGGILERGPESAVLFGQS
ncbi:hypothetical protein [Amycolatopsis sp. NPDC004079]|uniref:hypothetical protein n=1 Tax=Amycolatopsis sp. NPDC004079 TaxID=3154549 RepID=UPI0033AEABEA